MRNNFNPEDINMGIGGAPGFSPPGMGQGLGPGGPGPGPGPGPGGPGPGLQGAAPQAPSMGGAGMYSGMNLLEQWEELRKWSLEELQAEIQAIEGGSSRAGIAPVFVDSMIRQRMEEQQSADPNAQPPTSTVHEDLMAGGPSTYGEFMMEPPGADPSVPQEEMVPGLPPLEAYPAGEAPPDGRIYEFNNGAYPVRGYRGGGPVEEETEAERMERDPRILNPLSVMYPWESSPIRSIEARLADHAAGLKRGMRAATEVERVKDLESIVPVEQGPQGTKSFPQLQREAMEFRRVADALMDPNDPRNQMTPEEESDYIKNAIDRRDMYESIRGYSNGAYPVRGFRDGVRVPAPARGSVYEMTEEEKRRYFIELYGKTPEEMSQGPSLLDRLDRKIDPYGKFPFRGTAPIRGIAEASRHLGAKTAGLAAVPGFIYNSTGPSWEEKKALSSELRGDRDPFGNPWEEPGHIFPEMTGEREAQIASALGGSSGSDIFANSVLASSPLGYPMEKKSAIVSAEDIRNERIKRERLDEDADMAASALEDQRESLAKGGMDVLAQADPFYREPLENDSPFSIGDIRSQYDQIIGRNQGSSRIDDLYKKIEGLERPKNTWKANALLQFAAGMLDPKNATGSPFGDFAAGLGAGSGRAGPVIQAGKEADRRSELAALKTQLELEAIGSADRRASDQNVTSLARQVLANNSRLETAEYSAGRADQRLKRADEAKVAAANLAFTRAEARENNRIKKWDTAERIKAFEKMSDRALELAQADLTAMTAPGVARAPGDVDYGVELMVKYQMYMNFFEKLEEKRTKEEGGPSPRNGVMAGPVS